jgi:hypothetical protein
VREVANTMNVLNLISFLKGYTIFIPHGDGLKTNLGKTVTCCYVLLITLSGTIHNTKTVMENFTYSIYEQQSTVLTVDLNSLSRESISSTLLYNYM